MQDFKYNWLLFDADGTLFDYNNAEETAIRKTFSQLGYEYYPEFLDAYKKINNQMWKAYECGSIHKNELKTKRFAILLEGLKIKADHLMFSKNYLRNLSQCSRLLDGAEEICKALQKSYNLAVITNGFKEVQRPRYESSAIKDYFKEIIISDEIGAAKPDKKYFDIAFRMLGNPAKQSALIIGDSLTSDIKGGIDYGIDTCWFNPDRLSGKSAGIKYEIHSLEELLAIL